MSTNIIPRPEHPQPIMKRENWQNLNGEWLFEFDFGVSGEERGLYKPEKAGEYSKKITVLNGSIYHLIKQPIVMYILCSKMKTIFYG